MFFVGREMQYDENSCNYGQLVIDWQLHHNKCPLVCHICAEFLVKHQITPVTQPPYSLDLAP